MPTTNSDSSKSGSKSRFSKGKVLAGVAGVTAAAAAGYAAYRRSGNSAKVYHLQPAGDDGWEIRAEGAERATRVFDTKDEALTAARELARTTVPSELVIHRRDGSEADRHAYGQDPS